MLSAISSCPLRHHNGMHQADWFVDTTWYYVLSNVCFPVRSQGISWTNAVSLSVRINVQYNFKQNSTSYNQEYALDNIDYKMAFRHYGDKKSVNNGVTALMHWAIHDDVIKWKHFPRYWPFVRGIHRSPVNSPHKGQWRGALMFSLICVWINGWVNNREAGDLRRYRAHYNVTVMWFCVGNSKDHPWGCTELSKDLQSIYASLQKKGHLQPNTYVTPGL